jgi:hypothetical protein
VLLEGLALNKRGFVLEGFVLELLGIVYRFVYKLSESSDQVVN